MGKERKKKTYRNNAPGIIGDYWTTNREAYRQNQALAEKEGLNEKGRAWNKREIGLLVFIILGLIAIAIKYFVL